MFRTGTVALFSNAPVSPVNDDKFFKDTPVTEHSLIMPSCFNFPDRCSPTGW